MIRTYFLSISLIGELAANKNRELLNRAGEFEPGLGILNT